VGLPRRIAAASMQREQGTFLWSRVVGGVVVAVLFGSYRFIEMVDLRQFGHSRRALGRLQVRFQIRRGNIPVRPWLSETLTQA